MKKKTNIAIGIIIGIICLILWIKFINLKEVLSYLTKLKLIYIIIGSFLYLTSYFIRSIRWRMILAPVCNLKVKKAYFIWMAGFFLNYLIPIRAGEFAKSYFLKKTEGKAISRTLPSVFIDKVFDSLAIFVVIGLIPFLKVEISKLLLILIIILLAIVFLGIGILIISAIRKKLVVSFFHKFLFFIPSKYKSKFFEIIEIFVEGIGLFKHHYNILPKVILLTFTAILIDSIYFLCMFLAFGQVIPFPILLFGYTLIYLSYIIPCPPAQIGSNELIMVIIFSVGLGLNKEMVSAVMTLAHLLSGFLVVSIGFFSLSYLGIKLADTFKNVNIPEIEDEFKDKF
ncbi:MAG: flippase-like domain-containing protein [Candidatus Cloacimonetes bacterium]|nr:flippase-like domain-containing protein [Candidatus Cloacimonadota bacterium]MBL7085744.1 flippase-like domain-containing protein [Candidatus Cloacimonadota bacterium]